MNKFKSLLLSFLLTTCAPLLADIPFLYKDHMIFKNGSSSLNSPIQPPSMNEQEIIQNVQLAVSNASRDQSKLTPQVLTIDGMSSPKNRHLLNNLCSIKNTHYLEIGCWKGSTFISALFNNQSTLLSTSGIDSWIESEAAYLEFQQNCLTHIPDQPYDVYSEDCFSRHPNEYIKDKITLYFYDGGFTKEDLAKAFLFFNDVFDDLFVAIVDDWNWAQVREGTFEGFETLNYTILYEINLPARFNGDTEQWWNGLYVAVIRK